VQQPVERGDEHAVDGVGRVVGLDAAAEDAAPAHRVAQPRDRAQRRRADDEVLVAHELGDGGGDLGRERAREPALPRAGEPVRQHDLAQLAHGERADLREALAVVGALDELGDVVLDERRVGDLAERDVGERELRGHALELGAGGQPGELVPRLLLVGPGE
jgi:hypothetical protein